MTRIAPLPDLPDFPEEDLLAIRETRVFRVGWALPCMPMHTAARGSSEKSEKKIFAPPANVPVRFEYTWAGAEVARPP